METSDRMQFFSRLHLFNIQDIQDDRSTRFLCTANYKIDHIIKLFHEENSIISGLFSQNSLFLCGLQGNMGFQRKR